MVICEGFFQVRAGCLTSAIVSIIFAVIKIFMFADCSFFECRLLMPVVLPVLGLLDPELVSWEDEANTTMEETSSAENITADTRQWKEDDFMTVHDMWQWKWEIAEEIMTALGVIDSIVATITIVSSALLIFGLYHVRPKFFLPILVLLPIAFVVYLLGAMMFYFNFYIFDSVEVTVFTIGSGLDFSLLIITWLSAYSVWQQVSKHKNIKNNHNRWSHAYIQRQTQQVNN